MTSFGVTSTGFIPLRQSDILSALQARAREAFGDQVDLSPDEYLGQSIAIQSEREALLWAALQDLGVSGTVGGAEGIFVDNLLALLGIKRLPEAPTTTNAAPDTQTNGIILYGLLLYGTPGTVVAQGSIIQTNQTPALSFTLDAPVTIGAAQNGVQSIVFSRVPTAGSYTLGLLTPSGAVQQTPSIAYNALAQQVQVVFAQAPTTGAYALVIDKATTASLAYNATAAQVQAAIEAIASAPAVAVVPTGIGANYNLAFAGGYVPTVATTASTLDVTPAVIGSVQAAINGLVDTTTEFQPFTDVSVTQASQQTMSIAFGANTPLSAQPSSGAQAQARIGITGTGLLAGSSLVNASMSVVTIGQPASGIGSATCTAAGPNAVTAGSLSIIGSSAAGWTGVTNQLDCLTGRDVETGVQAMARRTTLLSSRGNGALPALIDKVLAVADVSAVQAFANVTAAALQRLHFSATPNGTFQLALGGYVTASLPATCTAAQLQTAIQALPSYSATQVSGSIAGDFIVDFNGSQGGQAQPLLDPMNNATGVIITPTFARPPKSVEMVVQGGLDADIAQAIFAAAPAGIATYGRPILQTTGSPQAGSTQISLMSVAGLETGMALTGQGLSPGSVAVGISQNIVTLNIGALSSYSNVAMTATTQLTVLDSQRNPHQIAFSRPIPTLVFLNLLLTTDYFNVPGNAGSGLNANAAFNPASLAQVQSDLAAILEAVPIGGLVVVKGTNGLDGAFREIAGVLDFDLAFDLTPSPTNEARLQLAAEQVLSVQLANLNVSFE